MEKAVILITGGAGFIGSNLADYLLDNGYKVRVLDNLSTGRLCNLDKAKSFGSRFQFICDDVTRSGALLNASEGVNCIIHLAAQVSVQYSLKQPVDSANTNVIGFINALEAARINNVERFIYASSAAVYGQPVELPLNELSETNPISPYGLEKLINERYVALYQSLYNISCLGFRFFNVYGPRQNPKSSYAGVISKFFELIATDQPITIFGDGHQSRDFVYVEDVAIACAKAINSSASGVICLGTGRSVNLLQLVEEIEFVVGKKASVIHADSVKGDIIHSSMAPINLINLLQVSAGVGLHDGIQLIWNSLRDCR